ncbi:hypothetical protein [Streptomyces sp. H27-C3]|uniref:hypothetical protein n=1 Tax=Streptomyces sp. H27-C3 TaxID=3046305 RepID=UPI0024BA7E1B|nr:hypothetical protein [Streptomyces sp. H27-C3]MDJ0462384.1 hypothetical protein [Streptomyces sp. H27-C3]
MSEHTEAVEALGRAGTVERAALHDSGWYARYLLVFAAGQLVLVPVAVLWHGLAAALVFALANAALVGGLSVYAAKQRVVRRGFGVRHGTPIGSWAVLFGLTVALSVTVFVDSPAFAVVAALGCALPPAVGARQEMRRSA